MFVINTEKYGTTEIRYINSISHKIGYQKRWGDDFIGIPQGYFSKLSQSKKEKGIRTIFIKDYEMLEHKDIKDFDGTIIKNYRRKWQVLKSYICTAAGQIHTRIYARDCEVREVPSHAPNNQAKPFMEKYCFYGNRGATLTLGLYLKKDKAGLKKGTLLFLSSFGMNFYGNKKHFEDPYIEVIRVGTICNLQVIGGATKILKHFLVNYPTIEIVREKEKINISVNKLIYYVDADHNDGRSMAASGYIFESWADAGGFHNIATCDIDIPHLKVSAGENFQRKPMIHKTIMQLMQEKKIVSVGHAGTIVYYINRDEWLKKLEENGSFI